MTIQHVEHWVTDADGTVYINAVADSYTEKKMGRSSRIVGTGCGDPLFHDANSARPTASTYRVRLEYTFDDPGSPAGVRILTAEGAVESRVPPRPLMTSLTMTSDLTGQRPQWDGRRPMTFTATGGGGTPPYQFQWRYGNNVVLRDWSADRTFVWDGTVPGATNPPGSADVTALARSARSTDAEVMKIMTISLR